VLIFYSPHTRFIAHHYPIDHAGGHEVICEIQKGMSKPCAMMKEEDVAYFAVS
jgi:hypothetical protein